MEKEYIYKILNDVDDKVYIGRSAKPYYRFHLHIKQANRCDKDKIHTAMRDYGVNNFYIRIIGEFDKSVIREKEQHFINAYDSLNNGYNSRNETAQNEYNNDTERLKIYRENQKSKNISYYEDMGFIEDVIKDILKKEYLTSEYINDLCEYINEVYGQFINGKEWTNKNFKKNMEHFGVYMKQIKLNKEQHEKEGYEFIKGKNVRALVNSTIQMSELIKESEKIQDKINEDVAEIIINHSDEESLLKIEIHDTSKDNNITN